jgi:hypothetical protein
MLGFMLVTLGIIFLILSNSDVGAGFVFVFPFFFFGNFDSIGLASIVEFVFFTSVLLLLILGNLVDFKNPDTVYEGKETYIIYDTTCNFCGESMSRNARFCPTCGKDNKESSQPD